MLSANMAASALDSQVAELVRQLGRRLEGDDVMTIENALLLARATRLADEAGARERLLPHTSPLPLRIDTLHRQRSEARSLARSVDSSTRGAPLADAHRDDRAAAEAAGQHLATAPGDSLLRVHAHRAHGSDSARVGSRRAGRSRLSIAASGTINGPWSSPTRTGRGRRARFACRRTRPTCPGCERHHADEVDTGRS
jgi:hypothetical protein